MPPTTEILVGHLVSGREARFLRTLREAFAGQDSLILANFYIRFQQVDFVVVTAGGATILEHKWFEGAIQGDVNGQWTIVDASGRRMPYPGGNPWRQALDQKFALSDEMRTYQAANPDVPPSSTGRFFKELAAFVCIEPRIHDQSEVIRGDERVWIRSAADAIADVRRGTTRSTWTIADWRRFATSRLRLRPVSLEEATDATVVSARDAVTAYRARVRALVGDGCPPLLDACDREDIGAHLIDRLCAPHNYVLVGPSGSAKTFHLEHLAINLCSTVDELPILVECRRYRGGTFDALLRQCIAPFFPRGPRALLGAARRDGCRPVLLVDALNECGAQHLQTLLRHIQAFALHYNARIVATSQQFVTLSAESEAHVVEMSLPDAAAKRAIFGYHARLTPSRDLDLFCAGFTNAYDLTIAGRCHASDTRPTSRAALYQRYVDQCLGERGSLVTALLCCVAGEMDRALSTTLTRDEFEDVAERFLSEQRASFEVLDALRQGRLVRVTPDSFEFEHELVFRYFTAESLRKARQSVEQLGAELRRPRHHDLAEFVLPRFTAREDVETLLDSASDVELFARIFVGVCGTTVRDVLVESAERLLDAARADLATLTADCDAPEFAEGRRAVAHITIVGQARWTTRDALMLRAVAFGLHLPRLQTAFLRLLDATEPRLKAMCRDAAEHLGLQPEDVWPEAVRLYGGTVQHGVLSLPCAEVLSTLRLHLMGWYRHKQGLAIRDALVERALPGAPSLIALLMLFEDRAAAERVEELDTNIALVECGLKSDVYIVRIAALDYVRRLRRTIDEGDMERLSAVRRLLETFEAPNILENTDRVVALGEYESETSGWDVDDALAEFRALLAPNALATPYILEMAEATDQSPFERLAGEACGCLAKMFEEIFLGVYMEAFGLLTDMEQREILLLAAQSTVPSVHHNWLLRRLLNTGDERALPVFQRFASDLTGDSLCPGERVAVYVTAIEGCARWSDVPPRLHEPSSPERHAWNVLGQILFWLHRPEDEQRARTIRALWASLTDETTRAAGDVLYQLFQARFQIVREDSGTVTLESSCQSEVARIVTQCLSSDVPVPSVFLYGGSLDFGFKQFLVDTLGDTGSEDALPLLNSFAEDARVGRRAIAAINQIRGRTREQ